MYNLEVDAQINFITLAVADVAASRKFYVDGLGWKPVFEVPNQISFIRISPSLLLSLWSASAFEEEVGPLNKGTGRAPFTLAYNVAEADQVDSVMATAVSAGATVLHPASKREWGGYSGYFTDPDGNAWEVAHNPSPLGLELVAASVFGAASAGARGEETIEVLRTRRSVGQGKLSGGPDLSHAEVVAAVESARWAPNHKRTEPWRFYLLDDDRKAQLAVMWSQQLERTGSKPDKVAAKLREWTDVPGVLIVTCGSAEDASELQLWEDYAAVAAAVQNLCLHLWAKGIATKWSTAGADKHEGFWPLLGFEQQPVNTRVVGFIFYGLVDELPKPHRKLGVGEVLVDFRHQ